MNKPITALLLALAVEAANAQEVLRPLSSTDTVQAESSRTAKTTWLGKVEGWDNYEPRTFTVARGDGALQTLLVSFRGQLTKLRFDAASFSTIPYVQEKAPEVLADTTTRQAGALAPGMKWTSRITYVGAPADWCPNDFKSTFDGTFEVEPQESYPLRIDGKDMTVSVLPVVERGTWNRCYTGKRYQRFLWSPDLQTVVAIEFQTYNPLGKLHEASYSMRVKEIERNKEGGRQ
jgi:hypothetical protein